MLSFTCLHGRWRSSNDSGAIISLGELQFYIATMWMAHIQSSMHSSCAQNPSSCSREETHLKVASSLVLGNTVENLVESARNDAPARFILSSKHAGEGRTEQREKNHLARVTLQQKQ